MSSEPTKLGNVGIDGGVVATKTPVQEFTVYIETPMFNR